MCVTTTILHVKSIKLTHILCVRCGFRRSLPFWACLSIIVIPVKRRSQSCTLRFWPLSTQRWFAPRKSSRSAFFSPVVLDLRAPWDMSQYQNSLRISLETSVLTCISKFASLWLCSWQSDWTRPRKRLGYEVNFLPRVRPRVVRSFYPLFICFSFSSLSDWLVRTID